MIPFLPMQLHGTLIGLPEIKLVGIAVRTSNALEMNSMTAKIGSTAQRFFADNLSAQIKNRINPGTTFCVYTNYVSDFTGDYTYFIGEKVSDSLEVGNGFQCLTIPAQNYVKFISQPGPMPSVCVEMWKHIWKMNPSDLGGERSYVADFEIYDQRSLDLNNTILDVYVGIRPPK